MDKLIDLCQMVYRENKKALESAIDLSLKNKDKMFIITANPEIIMFGIENQLMNEAMHNSTVITADGVGVQKMINWKFKCKCNKNTGIDIVQFLISEADKNQYSCFLYGAKQEVIDDLTAIFKLKFPGMIIIDSIDGYVKDREKVRQKIINSGADIILVALGAPSQEIFINSFFHEIKCGVCVGVGGAFDVLSGHTKRAPLFFINHNLEWLYRIIKEPKRLKRFWKGNVVFVIRLLFQKQDKVNQK